MVSAISVQAIAYSTDTQLFLIQINPRRMFCCKEMHPTWERESQECDRFSYTEESKRDRTPIK
ncbi:hypothetical protein [Brasilonema bromeliae]|uniref:hypothetical protein n=1 Tax=Brasilonema bromeliae TaxID=383615 RepID=UPI00145CF21F|nr:hypothetical protein [Brasilonema bromeliae]